MLELRSMTVQTYFYLEMKYRLAIVLTVMLTKSYFQWNSENSI
ncbi:unnamed protein product [Angiostrongylus costaricensis]|uniref:Uncharacterized protein n=1 Tax=Angiostrongylus costaricensis TaxID=334426 RepID=A0A0R3PVJ5_ANGCS|nr:unnamed protein product [Angiostrongylus costaricensis]